MPLYIGDYLADTGHLSTLEHGVYLLLIMHYWQNGGLPKDEKFLRIIGKISSYEWKKISPKILAFFDENFRHKRIDKELEIARELIEKRSVAGKAGASVRYGKRMANARNERSNRIANAQQTDSIVRVRNNHQDNLPSEVPDSTPAEKQEGSAEKQGTAASPETIEVTAALRGNRLARAG
jgi:uncharacterized protein YdaU (DUF1376 family)